MKRDTCLQHRAAAQRVGETIRLCSRLLTELVSDRLSADELTFNRSTSKKKKKKKVVGSRDHEVSLFVFGNHPTSAVHTSPRAEC